LNADETNEAQKLLAEAKRALPAENHQHDVKRENGFNPIVEASTDDRTRSKDEEDKEDEAEADAFLQQILDEVELEKQLSGNDDEHSSKAEEPPNNGTTSNAATDAPTFPSIPIHDIPLLPPSVSSSPPQTLFPSAPTSTPTSTAKKPQKKPQTFSDVEIDSWCIICCDDAKVRCQGCTGDLYCWGCWKEGHTGADVGLEEKGHRWVGLERGGKGS